MSSRLLSLGTAAFALSLFAADVAKARERDGCRTVVGRFSSAPRAPCDSPVGMCTAGELRGALRGDYAFTMATLVPSGDASVPAIHFYTGVSLVETRHGDLHVADTGTIDLDFFGRGKFVALLTITGGTEGHEGATGYLQLRGTLDFETGQATGRYFGEVCKP